MDNGSNLYGVMEGEYGDNRLKKPELIYRYKLRSGMAVRAVRRFYNPEKRLRILDFGSADGLSLVEIKRLLPAAEITGIEYSDELIKNAPLLPPGIRIIRGDVSKLPVEIESNGYDAVCALALLEHLDDPIKAIAEAKRALIPGGLLIATCPHPFWDRFSSKLGLLESEKHAQRLGKKLLHELFINAGMRIISYEKFMFAPVSFLPYLRINISSESALYLDNLIRKIKIFNWLFVNQCLVARKY